MDVEKIRFLLCGSVIGGNDNDEHVCRQPFKLSCSHFLCKSCLLKLNLNDRIKCKICDEINESGIDDLNESSTFQMSLNEQLKHVFEYLYEKFEVKLKSLRDILQNPYEAIDHKSYSI